MHGTGLSFGKPFVRKQYNVSVFLIVPTKSVEVPTELSEDCYSDLSVPIPNGNTIESQEILIFLALRRSPLQIRIPFVGTFSISFACIYNFFLLSNRVPDLKFLTSLVSWSQTRFLALHGIERISSIPNAFDDSKMTFFKSFPKHFE